MENELLKNSKRALVSVDDQKLVDSLLTGFHSKETDLNAAVDAYTKITSRDWTYNSLRSFFHGWRNPDGAAHAVSAITIRLTEAATNTNTGQEKLSLFEAAANLGQIIHDDVGLCELDGKGLIHTELYRRFAKSVCGDDSWQLEQYLIPSTKEFSKWVKAKRPLSPEIDEALEMMMLAEFFNTGEYNVMYPMFLNWMEQHMGYTKEESLYNTTFLLAHTGDVEASHFRHAVDALHLYSAAAGRKINYERIAKLSAEYVQRASCHICNLGSILVAK